MYIEHLQTPHPNIVEKDSPTPTLLVDAIQSINTPGELAAASAISKLAGKSLWFHNRPFTPDNLRERQTTNCLGYAIVGSECLTQRPDLVSEHYVAFANRHAFLVVPSDDEKGRRLASYDPLTPAFDGDITSALDRRVEYIERGVHDPELQRGVARLNARIFARPTSERERTFDELAMTNPWLTVGNTDSFGYINRCREGNAEQLLVLSVFAPKIGRHVLTSYASFRQAVDDRQYAAATKSLRTISGLYPEIDARTGHLEIRDLVKGLCIQGVFDIARASIHDYCSSFRQSKDPRLTALEAELLSKLANASNDQQVAEEAAAQYDNASQRSSNAWAPGAWTIRAKRLRIKFSLPARTHIPLGA